MWSRNATFVVPKEPMWWKIQCKHTLLTWVGMWMSLFRKTVECTQETNNTQSGICTQDITVTPENDCCEIVDKDGMMIIHEKIVTHENVCIHDNSCATNTNNIATEERVVETSCQIDITSANCKITEKRLQFGPKTFQEKCIDTLLNVTLITSLVSMLSFAGCLENFVQLVTQQFWEVVYKVYKGKGLCLLLGSKNRGCLQSKKMDRGSYDPALSNHNFAVPDVKSLVNNCADIPNLIFPGILEGAIKM